MVKPVGMWPAASVPLHAATASIASTDGSRCRRARRPARAGPARAARPCRHRRIGRRDTAGEQRGDERVVGERISRRSPARARPASTTTPSSMRRNRAFALVERGQVEPEIAGRCDARRAPRVAWPAATPATRPIDRSSARVARRSAPRDRRRRSSRARRSPGRPSDRGAPSMPAAPARRRAPRRRRPSRRGPTRAARTGRRAAAAGEPAQVQAHQPVAARRDRLATEHAHLHRELARPDVGEVRAAARDLVVAGPASTCRLASKRVVGRHCVGDDHRVAAPHLGVVDADEVRARRGCRGRSSRCGSPCDWMRADRGPSRPATSTLLVGVQRRRRSACR